MRSLCPHGSDCGGGRCLGEWLNKNVAAARHQAVLDAADCIDDLVVAADEAEITDTLGLDSWPGLARRRFLRAWRQLKDESQGDAAPAAAEPVAPPAVEAPAAPAVAPVVPPIAAAPVVAPAAPPAAPLVAPPAAPPLVAPAVPLAAPPLVVPAAPPAVAPVAPAVAPATPPVTVAPAAPPAVAPAVAPAPAPLRVRVQVGTSELPLMLPRQPGCTVDDLCRTISRAMHRGDERVVLSCNGYDLHPTFSIDLLDTDNVDDIVATFASEAAPPAAVPVAAPPPAVQAPPRAPPPPPSPAVPPVRELEEAPPALPPPDDDETTMTSRRSDSESGAEQAVPPDQAAQEAPVWFPPAPSPPPSPPAAPLPPAEPPVAQTQPPPPAQVVTQPPALTKSHVASAASAWAAACTDLLAAIGDRSGMTGMRGRLASAGFRCSPIRGDKTYYDISVPLTFPCCYDVVGNEYSAPNQDILRSKPQLVKYFKGCLALAQAGGAYRTEADREKDEGEDARRAALESDDDDAPHAPPQPIVRVPPPPRKATGQVEEFKVGDRVKALYQRGQRWYPGRVVAVNVQHRSLGVEVRSYSIKYDDDDKESNVCPANMRRIRAPAAARPPALPKPQRRAAGGAAARPFQPEEDSEGTPAAPALAHPATPRPAAPKKRAPRSLDLGPCRPGAQGPKSIFKQPDGPRRKRTRAEEPELLFREGDSVWALERPDIKEAAHGTIVEDVPVGASTGKVKWDNPAYPEAELPIAQIEPARSGRRSSR